MFRTTLPDGLLSVELRAAVLDVFGRTADRPAKPFVETVVPASPDEP
jgi:hypothetical protein